jgi:hypothetical protein
VGSILASGVNGINVNAAGANVILRNLSINGAGTTLGVKGISITAANSVAIENSQIMNFSQQCIVDTRATAGSLVVNNVDTRLCALTGVGTLSTGGTLKLMVNNVRSTDNGFGVAVSTNTNMMISNSVLSNNRTAGIDNEGATIVADGNAIANNGTGVLNNSGATRLSNNNIANNTTGINVLGGTVTTYGNNRNNTTTSGTVTAAGAATENLGQQ